MQLPNAAMRRHNAEWQRSCIWGEGRLGIHPDVRKAVAWYRLAAKNGEPIALQSLIVLAVTHPEIMVQEN